MKTVIINLSPRQRGTSMMLANTFCEKFKLKGMETEVISLYSKLEAFEEVAVKIGEAETAVMIGPCYVDTYPAETIRLLEVLAGAAGLLHGQKLYGFIQGGMPYAHTHESGLRLLENFAAENQMNWMGGFVMGGGAALNGQSLEHVIGAKKMVPAVELFVDRIAAGVKTDSELYREANVPMPAILAWLLSKCMGIMIRKNYRKLGIDYKQPSPYLVENR